MQRLLVLADTHVRDGRPRDLPRAVWEAVDEADAVLHAGDVIGDRLLDRLEARRPTHAVLGNNDSALVGRLARSLEFTVAGVPIAMVHETGPAKGRAARVRKWFPDSRVVVFGHSHAPYNQWHDGQLLFNPGSPTERRREPKHSYGWLEVDAGAVTRNEIVFIEPALPG